MHVIRQCTITCNVQYMLHVNVHLHVMYILHVNVHSYITIQCTCTMLTIRWHKQAMLVDSP